MGELTVVLVTCSWLGAAVISGLFLLHEVINMERQIIPNMADNVWRTLIGLIIPVITHLALVAAISKSMLIWMSEKLL